MTTRLDPTLEVTLDGLIAEAAAQAAADKNAGQSDQRTVWSLTGLDRTVDTVADLTPLLTTERIGALRLVKDEDTFYELTTDAAGEREWSKITSPDGILLEFEKLHGHFSRQECEVNYTRENNEDDGRVTRMIAAKLQSDVVSGVERDFRSRHRTALRSRMHAAALRQVAGSDRGTINNIRRYLKQFSAEIEEPTVIFNGVPPEPDNPGQTSI